MCYLYVECNQRGWGDWATSNDTIDGGSGSDTVNYVGNFADYGFSVTAGTIVIEDKNLVNGNEGSDRVSNIETLHFANKDVAVVNGLTYIASHADLINAYHANADAGLSHYLRFGFIEGRQISLADSKTKCNTLFAVWCLHVKNIQTDFHPRARSSHVQER